MPSKSVVRSLLKLCGTVSSLCLILPIAVACSSTQDGGTLAFSDLSYVVSEDGTFTQPITIVRTDGTKGAVAATVSLVAGEVGSSDDYQSFSTRIEFEDGDNTPKVIEIPIVDDTETEPVEDVKLRLTNATGGAVLGDRAEAKLAIIDNDIGTGFTELDWKRETAALEPQTEGLGAHVDGKFYVFGGYNTRFGPQSDTSRQVSVYDPLTERWTVLQDMPTKLTHAPTIVDGQFVYIFGGYVGISPDNYGTDVVWKYDTVTDEWSEFVPLPAARGGGAAALLDRNLHFFGGTNGDRTEDVVDHWVISLDDPNPQWREAAPLAVGRNHIAGVALDGKIYAVGGQLNDAAAAIFLKNFDVYDPVTDEWNRLPDLPTPRSHFTASTLVDEGRIILVAGQTRHLTALTNVTAYDVNTNQWIELTPLPAERSAPVAAVIGSELYVSGGWERPEPRREMWSAVLSGPEAEAGTSASTIPVFDGIEPVDEPEEGVVGAAEFTITPGADIQESNYSPKSFTVVNTGDKRIAAIYFDVTKALFPDTVFDPVGQAGDNVARGLKFSQTGNTGVFEPSFEQNPWSDRLPFLANDVLEPFYGYGGPDGYEGLLLTFNPNQQNGFEPGESVSFGVDMDPNSIEGLPQKIVDANGNDPRYQSWDIGGVSGAELIDSEVHVLFTDGTTATGDFIGDGSQGGAGAFVSQASPQKTATLRVNGLQPGDAGHYNSSNFEVLVSGEEGDLARVVLVKGFIQPFPHQLSEDAPKILTRTGKELDLANRFISHPFPANQALEFQTVDVLLDGTEQDISELFDMTVKQEFADLPDVDTLPIAIVASIVDANNTLASPHSILKPTDRPLGPVTAPIYLSYGEDE